MITGTIVSIPTKIHIYCPLGKKNFWPEVLIRIKLISDKPEIPFRDVVDAVICTLGHGGEYTYEAASREICNIVDSQFKVLGVWVRVGGEYDFNAVSMVRWD